MFRPKACAHKKYPVKLICSRAFQSTSESTSNRPGWSTPALLIRTSHLPKAASARDAAAETLSASETSHSRVRLPRPAAEPLQLSESNHCRRGQLQRP